MSHNFTYLLLSGKYVAFIYYYIFKLTVKSTKQRQKQTLLTKVIPV